jgi:hypothetical protein
MKRLLGTLGIVIGLLVAVLLLANLLAASPSTEALVDLARSRCVQDGFPAQNMMVTETEVDNGMLGFGGRATVQFSRVGLGPWPPDQPRVLRVELRRRMSLLGWEAVSVWHEP